jgi:hypothetical protein
LPIEFLDFFFPNFCGLATDGGAQDEGAVEGGGGASALDKAHKGKKRIKTKRENSKDRKEMDKDAGEWGRYNGEEVANKGTVLGTLDRLLNKGEPPDLELIFILPFPVPPPSSSFLFWF